MWANADTEKLDLQGCEGVSYFGVIQVIDFCNGKVIGDRLPPERHAERGPGREMLYTAHKTLCVW